MIIALLLDNLYTNSDTLILNLGCGSFNHKVLKVCESVKECECESEISTKTISVNNGTTDKFRFEIIVLLCECGRKTKRTDKFIIEKILKSIDN